MEESVSRLRIRKGDTVRVIAGKEKGKTGKVLQVKPGEQKLYIEKINMIKRHVRPSARYRPGGIIEKEAPLHVSNVMLVCPNCGKASRIGIRSIEDGNRLRYCKKCGEIIDRA